LFTYFAELGGQAFSLIAVLGYLIGHYQTFAYENSNIRTLYFHEKEDDDDENHSQGPDDNPDGTPNLET